MQLLKEIYEQLSEENEPITGFRFTLWAGKGGYFQNIRTIVAFRTEEIELFTQGKERVKITGRGLSVKKYCESDVLIGGDIYGVTREGKGESK